MNPDMEFVLTVYLTNGEYIKEHFTNFQYVTKDGQNVLMGPGRRAEEKALHAIDHGYRENVGPCLYRFFPTSKIESIVVEGFEVE